MGQRPARRPALQCAWWRDDLRVVRIDVRNPNVANGPDGAGPSRTWPDGETTSVSSGSANRAKGEGKFRPDKASSRLWKLTRHARGSRTRSATFRCSFHPPAVVCPKNHAAMGRVVVRPASVGQRLISKSASTRPNFPAATCRARRRNAGDPASARNAPPDSDRASARSPVTMNGLGDRQGTHGVLPCKP